MDIFFTFNPSVTLNEKIMARYFYFCRLNKNDKDYVRQNSADRSVISLVKSVPRYNVTSNFNQLYLHIFLFNWKSEKYLSD